MFKVDREIIKIVGFRAWIEVKIEPVTNYFLRIWFCQHNARVLIDMESRLSAVLCQATGSRISKAYYSKETMLELVGEHQDRLYNAGHADGWKECCETYGIEEETDGEE